MAGSLPISYPFEEQLVPTGPTSQREDSDLEQAVESYRHRPAPDVRALSDFLKDHPNSAWTLALLTNIGLSDYHYGYFSRAITDFQEAWEAGQSASAPHAKTLADRAVAELLRMHARLGHMPELTALLNATQDRDLAGSATALRDGAKEGLWLMRNKPGESFLCGPMALKSLLHARGIPAGETGFIDAYQSSPHGVTLAELSQLADQAKLPHVLVHRAVGEPIPLPSIVHWKVNHYAAIVGQRGDLYHIADPTFGPDLWVTRRALDSDASGYFLVPTAQDMLNPVWKTVTTDEAGRIFGMGKTTGNDQTKVTPLSHCACDGKSSSDHGLTTYNFKEMLVSLHLSDTPVGYVPPVGPPVRVQLVYNQMESAQPANPNFFNVGPLWTLNFLSYITDDTTNVGASGATATRFEGGGGESVQNNFSSSKQSFAPDVQDYSVLSLVSSNPITYKRTLRNGGFEIYSASNGATGSSRLVFLTQIVDAAGNALTLNYDSMLRLSSIVDAVGRSTTLSYGLSGSPFLVTQITDPFGRFAQLSYNSSGQLSDIIDVIGMKSHFDYASGSLNLTTPYGVTKFAFSDNGDNAMLSATDPLGYTEFLEFYQPAGGSNVSDPDGIPGGMVGLFNQWITERDTYYWNKHAYAVGAGNLRAPFKTSDTKLAGISTNMQGL